MDTIWPGSLVLAGAGKMGGALLLGWLAGGLDGRAVRIVDPHLDAASAADWCLRGVTIESGHSTLPSPTAAPEILVLAMKPQSFAERPDFYSPLAGPGTLVVSILAGKTLGGLREALPNAGAIVRAMPNLPASIGHGATGLAGEAGLSAERRVMASTLMGAVGHIDWLDESLIDAVTALSGSGPAYVFYLVECLAEAGIAAGLSPDVAMRLARATVEGAGALLSRQPDIAPGALREAVTSPGGTTAAALDVLRATDGLAPLMTKAVAAAAIRAKALAT